MSVPGSRSVAMDLSADWSVDDVIDCTSADIIIYGPMVLQSIELIIRISVD
jgi:hypothetical protein